MKRYNLSFRFSRNGTSWSTGSTFVTATSASDAMAQVRNMYAYVKDIRVLSVR